MKYIDKYQILYNIFNTMGQIENTEGIKFQICRKSKSICFSHWIKSLKIVGVKTLPERTESEKLKLVLVYPLKPF